MIREIKFRAWNKTGEHKMLRVAELKWEMCKDGVERLYFNGRFEDEMGEITAGVFSGFGATNGSEDISPWVLMQYTGLKDKNDKEIYKGDILAYDSIDYHKNTYQVRYEVRFGEYDNGEDYDGKTSGCGWWLKRFLLVRSNGEFDETVGIYDYQGLQGLSEMAIIGNIYENPELMEANGHTKEE